MRHSHYIDRDSLIPSDMPSMRTLELLKDRELNHHQSGKHPKLGSLKTLPSKILTRLDRQHTNLITFMLEFRQAMKSKRFNRMDMAAKQLVNRILNHQDEGGESPFAHTLSLSHAHTVLWLY